MFVSDAERSVVRLQAGKISLSDLHIRPVTKKDWTARVNGRCVGENGLEKFILPLTPDPNQCSVIFTSYGGADSNWVRGDIASSPLIGSFVYTAAEYIIIVDYCALWTDLQLCTGCICLSGRCAAAKA